MLPKASNVPKYKHTHTYMYNFNPHTYRVEETLMVSPVNRFHIERKTGDQIRFQDVPF